MAAHRQCFYLLLPIRSQRKFWSCMRNTTHDFCRPLFHNSHHQCVVHIDQYIDWRRANYVILFVLRTCYNLSSAVPAQCPRPRRRESTRAGEQPSGHQRGHRNIRSKRRSTETAARTCPISLMMYSYIMAGTSCSQSDQPCVVQASPQ